MKPLEHYASEIKTTHAVPYKDKSPLKSPEKILFRLK